MLRLACLLTLAFAAATAAQEPPTGAEDLSLGGPTSEAVDLVLSRQAAGLYDAPDWRSRPRHTVPIVFHIVRDSQGRITHPSGWRLDERIPNAMDNLNRHYALSGIQFCQAGPPLYIDSDFWANWEPGATIEEMLQIDWVEGAVNLYLFPEPRHIGAVIAHTWTPIQSIGMRFVAFNGLATGQNVKFTRMISYYFDLFRTDEDRFGIECASGSNCEVAGDLVCDTPAEAQAHLVNSLCEYNSPPPYPGPCAGDPMYTPDKENIMSKRRDPCIDHLTQGQQDRAYATLVNIRHEIDLAMCGCPADCDLSGNLDVFDFLCFQSAFFDEEPYACNMDVSTGGLTCDIFDFLAFQDHFMTGCP